MNGSLEGELTFFKFPTNSSICPLLEIFCLTYPYCYKFPWLYVRSSELIEWQISGIIASAITSTQLFFSFGNINVCALYMEQQRFTATYFTSPQCETVRRYSIGDEFLSLVFLVLVLSPLCFFVSVYSLSSFINNHVLPELPIFWFARVWSLGPSPLLPLVFFK